MRCSVTTRDCRSCEIMPGAMFPTMRMQMHICFRRDIGLSKQSLVISKTKDQLYAGCRADLSTDEEEGIDCIL